MYQRPPACVCLSTPHKSPGTDQDHSEMRRGQAYAAVYVPSRMLTADVEAPFACDGALLSAGLAVTAGAPLSVRVCDAAVGGAAGPEEVDGTSAREAAMACARASSSDSICACMPNHKCCMRSTMCTYQLL